MSRHIVDDEQRSDRRATPMRPSGSGVAGASASLALIDDAHRHRLRRAALHLPSPRQERGPFYYSDRLLDENCFKTLAKRCHRCKMAAVLKVRKEIPE
jgi:hypothetical protein